MVRMDMRFFKKGARKAVLEDSDLVGVQVTDNGLAVAHVHHEPGGRAQVVSHAFYQGCKSSDHLSLLQQFVKEHDLQNVCCIFTLPVSQYQINLLETPSVEQHELAQTMQWLVQDSIDYPIEEAVVDVFELPLCRGSDNAKMAYVVTAKKEDIKQIKKLVQQSGLILRYIDIPELSLRNVAALHESDKNGGVFVLLDRCGGQLVLTRNKMINMTKRIELNLDSFLGISLGSQDSLETLNLNIKNSVDYFANVFRTVAVNTVVLMPSELQLHPIQEHLNTHVDLDVRLFALEDYVDFKQAPTKQEQASCLLAVGSALRQFSVESSS